MTKGWETLIGTLEGSRRPFAHEPMSVTRVRAHETKLLDRVRREGSAFARNLDWRATCSSGTMLIDIRRSPSPKHLYVGIR
jgi:hypothetical protein